jgi:hypothetical protein
MDEEQVQEIERLVNAATASCRNCPGLAELEQMQRDFHMTTFNVTGPFDQSWPQIGEYNLPSRCAGCYIVEKEYATDE